MANVHIWPFRLGPGLNWEAMASSITTKRAEREKKINDFLRDHKLELDQLNQKTAITVKNIKTIEEMTGMFLRKVISAKDVMLLFCQAAAEAQSKTNCLTEVLFEEALNRAEELDKFLESEGKLIGPFHGVPFSIKDTFSIEGFGKLSETLFIPLFTYALFYRLYNRIRKVLREAEGRKFSHSKAYLCPRRDTFC